MITETKTCSKGTDVVREGDPGDALYLVIGGELEVIKGVGSKHEVVLDQIGKDDFFGEISLIDRKERSATVRAASDAFLLSLKGEDFTRILEENPSITLNICKVLCRRIQALHRRLQDSE